MLKAVNTKDPKEVTVTLPEDSEVTAEDLKEQTITMTDKDKNVIEATFKEITEDGKVIFTAEKALEDAVEYKVTADWATFEKDTFTAQVKEAYVKNLAPASTVLLVEKATEENENKAKKVEIPVQAFDQYGKEIAMNAIADGAEYKIKKGSAFIGAMPLTDEEINIDSEKETVTVTHTALKKGETIKFVVELVEKDKDKKEVVKFEAPFVYDDLRDEDPIVDSVTLTTEGGTSLAYDEKVKDSDTNKEIKLHADVRNQYNSKMNEPLRWVVNGEVQSETSSTFTINSSKDPGEYKVQVFSTTDASKFDEVTITISDAPIRELTAKTELKNIEDEKTPTNDIFNKEQLQLGTVEANKGAKLTPEQLKFEVIVTDDKLSKDDIQVTAEYAKGEDGKEDQSKIVVKAKTDKAGTYKVIPYVGNSYTDKAAVKAENAFEVTTTVNPEIATIEEIKFDPTKLKLNQEIKEEIVIKNKHGERLTAEQVKDKIDVVSSKPEVVDEKEKGKSIVQGTTDADKDKTYLVLQAGEKAGTAVVTVQSKDNTSVLQTYTLDFVKAELAKVKLAQKTVKGVVAGDEKDKAQYNEVQFLDQHGLEIKEDKPATKVVDADGEDVTDVEAEVVKGAFDKEGNFVTEDAINEESNKDLKDQVKQYVKVSAEKATKAGNYTVIVAAKEADLTDDKAITGKFDVEVGAPRTVKDITLAPKSSTVATGAKAKITVNLVDQYGEPYTLKAAAGETPAETLAVQLIDKKDETIVKDDVTYKEVTEGKEGTEDTEVVPGAYEIVLPMDKSGDYELVVAFGEGDAKKSESVTIQVGDAVDLVEKLAITGKHIDGDQATVKLYKDDSNGMALGLDAFDKDGNKVNINSNDIHWSSSNPKVATVENGVVKVVSDASLEEDQTVTITADLKGHTTTVDIVVSAEEPKVQKDTLVATMKEDGKNVEVTEVTIDEKATDGTLTLTFKAVDQYGNELTINGKQFSILEPLQSGVFEVQKPTAENTDVIITALGEGDADLRVKVDDELITVKVKVTQDAVDQVAVAKAEEALQSQEAKAAFKALEVDDATNEELKKQAVKAEAEKHVTDGVTVTKVEKAPETRTADAADEGETTVETETYLVTLEKNKASKVVEVEAAFGLTEKAKNEQIVNEALAKVDDNYELASADVLQSTIQEKVGAGVTVAVEALEDNEENTHKVTLTAGEGDDAVSKEKEVTVTEIFTAESAVLTVDSEETVTQEAAAAKATIGGVEFEAVQPGVAGNEISIEIKQGEATSAENPVKTSVAVENNKVTITLGATFDADTSTSVADKVTVTELKTAIEGSEEAKELIKVVSDDTTEVTVSTSVKLADGKEEKKETNVTSKTLEVTFSEAVELEGDFKLTLKAEKTATVAEDADAVTAADQVVTIKLTVDSTIEANDTIDSIEGVTVEGKKLKLENLTVTAGE